MLQEFELKFEILPILFYLEKEGYKFNSFLFFPLHLMVSFEAQTSTTKLTQRLYFNISFYNIIVMHQLIQSLK